MYRKLGVYNIRNVLKPLNYTTSYITIQSRAAQTQKVTKFQSTYLVEEHLLSNARCQQGSRFSQSWI